MTSSLLRAGVMASIAMPPILSPARRMPDRERKQCRDNDVHRVHDDPQRRRELYDDDEADLDHHAADGEADDASNATLIGPVAWGHGR